MIKGRESFIGTLRPRTLFEENNSETLDIMDYRMLASRLLIRFTLKINWLQKKKSGHADYKR